MGWRFVVGNIEHLNVAIEKKFDIIQLPIVPRWQRCLFNLGFNNYKGGWVHGAIGSMYARKYFGTQQKIPIKIMIEYLKDSFRKIIEKTTWMAEETKQIALKKLDAMKDYIAYPDELLNHTIVDNFHKGK